MSLTSRLHDLLTARFTAPDLRQLVTFDESLAAARLSDAVNFDRAVRQVALELVEAATQRNLLAALAAAAAHARPLVPEAAELARLFAADSETPGTAPVQSGTAHATQGHTPVSGDSAEKRPVAPMGKAALSARPAILSGPARIEIRAGLVSRWVDLADYFHVPLPDRDACRRADSPPGRLLDWLEERKKLHELRDAFSALGWDDLVEVIDRQPVLSVYTREELQRLSKPDASSIQVSPTTPEKTSNEPPKASPKVSEEPPATHETSTRRLWARLLAEMIVSLLLITCAVASLPDDGGVPNDEALKRHADEDYSSPAKWRAVAEKYYPLAEHDYFEEMDGYRIPDNPRTGILKLTPDEVKGRNDWMLWTGGNEAFWDWFARHGYGTVDLLRLIDYTNRDSRFARTGLINEPGTRPPTEDETLGTYGVRFARPVTSHPDSKKIHAEYGRTSAERPPASTFDPNQSDDSNYPVYGYPSGVMGLRLFPNPEFTGTAVSRWRANLHLYYSDTPEGREYAARPDTIRPYRVGMSCGFCHVAPHPLNPPANVEYPEWANLSATVGNQYLRGRAVFGNMLKPDNYAYHLFDSQLPGTLDTSLIASDNVNNPTAITAFFGLRARLDRATRNPKEAIGADSLGYLRADVDALFPDSHHTPRILVDGSDSIGFHLSVSRAYLNIGTHYQQWARLHNPLLGFRKQEPFKLRDVANSSLYWHATHVRIDRMASFLLRPPPALLKNAPLTDAQKKQHLRGTGEPWYAVPKGDFKNGPFNKDPIPDPAPLLGGSGDYSKGRQVFAKSCVACHSSYQPGDEPGLEAWLVDETLPRPATVPGNWDPMKLSEAQRSELSHARRALRLTADHIRELTRGNGALPPAYARWAQQAVNQTSFWGAVKTTKDASGRWWEERVYNYLSTDERIPVTITNTNSARAAATNATHGHIWEDFASVSYKELGPVGRIQYRDPFSKTEKSYDLPKGGPGYYRVPTLIGIWATAPFLHNNSIGKFNNDPSVSGRLEAFDDAITRMLWPEKRAVPSQQFYWDGTHSGQVIHDAWYPGKEAGKPTSVESAAAQRETDGGWIWRTTEESWIQISGPSIPQFVGGVIGLSPAWMRIVPWMPAGIFVLLGITLLLRSPLVGFDDRLLLKLPWLGWLFEPFRWIFAACGLTLVAFSYILVVRYTPLLTLLDTGRQHSILSLRLQASLIPVVVFVYVGLMFSLRRLPADWRRTRVLRCAGALYLILAFITALGFGRFLAGSGGGIRLGPIPQGVPVNALANFDSEASFEQRNAALNALLDFSHKHQKMKTENKESGGAEFEQTIGPVLSNTSKCPDFVIDRGHDFECIRQLTDDEKHELIALLKTF